jgi:hypothetical protein
MKIQESHRKNDKGINQFRRKNPAFVIVHRNIVTVNHRRPEELQYPWQFDKLQSADGGQRKIFLPHDNRNHR